MSDIRREDFVANLFTLLTETFEGPPRSAAYLDQRAGLFDTLESISANQASRPVAEGATSIAAQVDHTRFYIDVIGQFMDGRAEAVNWEDSWRVQEVTPEAWSDLQRDLRSAYESVTQKFRSISEWNDDDMGDSLAVLIHTAYHLGAIRQIIKVTARG